MTKRKKYGRVSDEEIARVAKVRFDYDYWNAWFGLDGNLYLRENSPHYRRRTTRVESYDEYLHRRYWAESARRIIQASNPERVATVNSLAAEWNALPKEQKTQAVYLERFYERAHRAVYGE